MSRIIVHPGLYDSSPDHWQSRWLERNPSWHRVQQANWCTPSLAAWVETLHAAIGVASEPAVLVCHSAACIAAVARVVRYGGADVAAALFVAPADADATSFPAGTSGFAPVPLVQLPFPSLVVASDNDPYAAIDRSRAFAAAWGSQFVELPKAGHINAEAGYGDWEQGLALLGSLIAQASAVRTRA